MYGVQNIGNFTTIDTGQPKIVNMSPLGFDVPLSTNTVTITFNEEIDPTTLNGFSLGGYNDITLTFQSISLDNKVATFSMSDSLVDSGFYVLKIPSTVKDMSGNSIEIPPYFWMFQAEDHTAPSVYKLEPNGNIVNPDTPGQIVLYFTEPVNESSIVNAVELIGGSQTPPTISFDRLEQYNTIAYFNINGSLEQRTDYTIKIKDGISDKKGNVSSVPVNFNFKTGDTIPPTVVSVTPEGLNIPYKTDQIITVTFDEEMDVGSVKNALEITDTNGIVPYNFENYEVVFTNGNITSSVATYRINKIYLSSYMPYTIKITGAKDIYQNVIQPITYTDHFRTASDTNPQVIGFSISECNGKTQLKIDYDREMKPVLVDIYGNDRHLDAKIKLKYTFYDRTDSVSNRPYKVPYYATGHDPFPTSYHIEGVYNTCEIENPDYNNAALLCMVGGYPTVLWACPLAWSLPKTIVASDPKCGLKPFNDEFSDDPTRKVLIYERNASKYEVFDRYLRFKYFTNGNRSIIFESSSVGYFQIPESQVRIDEYKIYATSIKNEREVFLKDLNDKKEILSGLPLKYGDIQKNVCY